MAVIVPRNFRLLDELEQGEKSRNATGQVSYGLKNADDILMHYWCGTIFGPPGTAFENRILFIDITCGDKYPDEPPTVQFSSKVNMGCVGSNGLVSKSAFPLFANWKRDYTIETVLKELLKEMASSANRKLPQPPEGSSYS
eukprot:PhF_6_TR13649/c0_g1_i2/m.21890/K10704/UBE2V; ubiquitin-conjugating enzyme E2 variant